MEVALEAVAVGVAEVSYGVSQHSTAHPAAPGIVATARGHSAPRVIIATIILVAAPGAAGTPAPALISGAGPLQGQPSPGG